MAFDYDGATVTVRLAPNDNLFTAAPTYSLDVSNDVRGQMVIRRSGRTDQLRDTQPGYATIVLNGRDRTYDASYGPAALVLDGSGGDYWSPGDVAAMAGATKIDLRFAISLVDWTPATDMAIFSQWGAAGQRACRAYIAATTGALTWVTSNDGTAVADAFTAGRFCTSDGQAVCGRITWEASTGTANFYIKRVPVERLRDETQSNDGWVLVGADATAGTTALFNSTTTVRIGLLGNNNDPLNGTVYYLQCAKVIDGTPFIVFDPADAASTSSTSWTGTLDGLSWAGTGGWTLRIQSDVYGLLGPGTPVEIKMSYAATEEKLFTGYLRRAPQRYPAMGTDAEVVLECVDMLAFLQDKPAPQTPAGIAFYATYGANMKAYWPLHEPTSALDISDDFGVSPGRWSGAGASGAATQPMFQTTTRALVSGVVGNTFVAPTTVGSSDFPQAVFLVNISAETDTFRLVVGDASLRFDINYGVGGVYRFQVDRGGTKDSSTFDERLPVGSHILVATDYGWFGLGAVLNYAGLASQLAYTTYGIGTHTGDTSATTGFYVTGDGATISDIAWCEANTVPEPVWRAARDGRFNDTGGERVGWLLDAAGIPSALRDISTDAATYMGTSTAGGTYGSLLRDVDNAESGRSFVNRDGKYTFYSRLWNHTATRATVTQATFDDTAGSDSYSDITLLPLDWSDVINECIVTLPNGARGVYRDQASRDAVGGWRTHTISAPCASPEDATSLARYIVEPRSFPRQRVSKITVKPRNKPSTLFAHVRDRNIGDRIVAKRSPTATLIPSSTTEPITMTCQIEGIEHRIHVNGTWETDFITGPAAMTSAEAGFITIDDTALGNYDAGLRFVP